MACLHSQIQTLSLFGLLPKKCISPPKLSCRNPLGTVGFLVTVIRISDINNLIKEGCISSNDFRDFGILWWGGCGGVKQCMLFQAGSREREWWKPAGSSFPPFYSKWASTPMGWCNQHSGIVTTTQPISEKCPSDISQGVPHQFPR